MRLFIGIELPAQLQAEVSRATETLAEELARVAPRIALRWVRPPNLHLTVWFLGEVDEPRAGEIIEVLGEPFQTPAFTLRIGGVGTFPPSGPPRALWLGVHDGASSLVAVHAELSARLGKIGLEPERRGYSPHLTVGRFKEVRRADVSVVRRLIARSTDVIGECGIDAVALVRSRLSPKGSQYEKLLRVPLG
jgi:RNA 2',3'-cyclic 3'-phosphodiesterase